MTVPAPKSTAPGRADADAAHLLEAQVGLVHGILDAAGDAFDHGVHAALRLGAELGAADALLRVREDAREDLGPAEVNPDDVFCSLLLWFQRIELAVVLSYLPASTALIFFCSSALMASADRWPSTMVKP